jgi:hypothetical protein
VRRDSAPLDVGQQTERHRDEPFHVARAATKESIAADDRIERVARPMLTGYGHDIGMTREDDAAIGLAVHGRQRGEQIRLLSAPVIDEQRFNVVGSKAIPDRFDQAEIRAAARRVVTNKLLKQREARCAFVGVSGAFIRHGMVTGATS